MSKRGNPEIREVNGIRYEFDQIVSKCSTTVPVTSIETAKHLLAFVKCELDRITYEIKATSAEDTGDHDMTEFKLSSLERSRIKLKELSDGLLELLADPNLLEAYPFTATLSLYIPHVTRVGGVDGE